MMTDAERIVEATMCCTLRPKKNDREKVIAEVLRFIIEEYQDYRDNESLDEVVISCRDLWELIHDLEDTKELAKIEIEEYTDEQIKEWIEND